MFIPTIFNRYLILLHSQKYKYQEEPKIVFSAMPYKNLDSY